MTVFSFSANLDLSWPLLLTLSLAGGRRGIRRRSPIAAVTNDIGRPCGMLCSSVLENLAVASAKRLQVCQVQDAREGKRVNLV